MSPLDLPGIPLGHRVSGHRVRCPKCRTIQDNGAKPVQTSPHELVYKCDTCDQKFRIKKQV
jgi:DNA-directed RNA polymerase subunit RPC12/RpoP